MPGYIKAILKIIVVAVGGYALAVIVGGLISDQTVSFTPEAMSNSITLAIWGVLMLLFLVYVLDASMKGKNVLMGTSKNKEKSNKQFFDSKFLSTKELNKITTYSLYSQLKNAKDGILVRAEVKGNNLHVNMRKPIHTMVIGTTGSGKTTMYVDPFLQIMPETKTRPSLVITDPKGELYANHAHKLKQKGYNVKVLNLRDVFSSTRWNPMGRA